MKKLLVCDVEGTIFEAKYKIDGTDYASTMWQPLAHCLGQEAIDKERETHKKWENKGYNNYVEWVKATFEIHKEYKLTKTQFDDLVKRAEYIEGVVDFFKKIDRSKYIPVLVSGGFEELINRAQVELDIEYGAAACKYIFENSRDELLLNCSLKPCDFEGKYDYVQTLFKTHGLDYRTDWVFIGDGKNDVDIANLAPLSFGINAHSQLAEVVTFNVGNFHQIYDLLEKYERYIDLSKPKQVSGEQLPSSNVENEKYLALIRSNSSLLRNAESLAVEIAMHEASKNALIGQLKNIKATLDAEKQNLEAEKTSRRKLKESLEKLEKKYNESNVKLNQLTIDLKNISKTKKNDRYDELNLLKTENMKIKSEQQELLDKLKYQNEVIETKTKLLAEKHDQITALTEREKLEGERLNFEQRVFKALTNTKMSTEGDWHIRYNFDANPDGRSSKFTDCLVISRYCIVVIEVKNYVGKLYTYGDVKNDKWMCENQSGRQVPVNSMSVNPYHQLQSYCSEVRNLVAKRSNLKIPVYGIVVFPEKADISELGEDLGVYYRVSTMDNMVSTIENIENVLNHRRADKPVYAPDKILDILLGRPIG